jgi:hypothetical protein
VTPALWPARVVDIATVQNVYSHAARPWRRAGLLRVQWHRLHPALALIRGALAQP